MARLATAEDDDKDIDMASNARMWSELFGGNSLVDGRSNTEAVMDAVRPGAGLLNVGGSIGGEEVFEEPEVMGSLLSPGGMSAPISPYEQARQNHGDGFGFFMKSMLASRRPDLARWIMPELSAENIAQYDANMKLYNEQQNRLRKQQLYSDFGGQFMEAFQTPETEDDVMAFSNAIAGGLGLDEVKYLHKIAGKSYQDPEWETKFDNGVLVRYDKNGVAPTQVVLDDNGGQITEKMDGDMRKTAGWFKRAVPALENMHKLEDRGVTLPREVLMLMQQAQDADGIFQPQIYNKLINDIGLEPEQRQYLRTAQDLAMIQLRKESGAAIGVQEMFNELNQNVMLDDMNDEGYAYQRGSRNRKYRALSEGMPSYLIDEFKADGYFDTLDKLRKGSSRVTQSKPPELLDRNTGPATGAPKVGFQKDGYIFNGGDPADPANWSEM